MSKKEQTIRNVRAFVGAYLKGKNGQAVLKANKPLAHAFKRAVSSRHQSYWLRGRLRRYGQTCTRPYDIRPSSC
jgi:hypothetical protein